MDIQEPSLTKTTLSPTIFSTLFHNMFDSVVIYNYETETIKDCNQSVLKLLGFTKEELLTKSRFDLMPNQSVLYPNVDIHRFMKNEHRLKVVEGESIFSRSELLDKKGNSIFADINIVPIEKGTADAFVIVHDITQSFEDRKKLKESKEEYRTIINGACESIVYYDLKSNKLVRCNNVVMEMFGVADRQTFLDADIKKFYAKNDGILNTFGFEDFFSRSILEAKENGNSCYRFLANRLDEGTFVAELTTTFSRQDKEFPKAIFFIKDITENYSAQQEQEKFYHEQEQILDSMPIQFCIRGGIETLFSRGF